MKTVKIVIIILIIAAVGSGYFLLNQQPEQSSAIPENEQQKTNQGSTTFEQVTDEPESTETNQDSTTLEYSLKNQFAEKFGEETNNFVIEISEETDKHAKGGITFPDSIGGGWWLAAKVDSKWLLVADGNGTVMCSDIEPYNFPSDMVPECYNQDTQQLITR